MSKTRPIGSTARGRGRLPIPSSGPMPGPRVSSFGGSSLLMLDPDLAEGLGPEARSALRDRMLARVEAFSTGSWEPRHGSDGVSALLVIDGLLVREVEVAERTSAELFGAGDMIHPPADDEDPSAIPAARWNAILPGHAALLDDRLLASITRSLPLLFALAGRATRRGRMLGALALIRTMRRTEDRLVFLLTFLAGRWGYIRPDGIRLSLPATHELLARLIGTRRQAVTTALNDLRSRGLIMILPGGDWLLTNRLSLSWPLTEAAARGAAEGGASDVALGGPPMNLLHADAGLAGVLSTSQLALAAAHTHVQTQVLPIGDWHPAAPSGDGSCSDWLGLLVLDGFLSLETSYKQETALEIVGPGDLLRPWDGDLEYPLPAIANRWQALTPVTVALLDGELAARIAPWPALTAEILARAGRRARWLTARLAISQQIHIRDRVLYLFSRLASRWGVPGAVGVVVPLPLTHGQIGKLIGAQRPSVTIAVGELSKQGLLTRLPNRTWLIDGRESRSLLDSRESL